jgi:hypothetical protein
MVMTSRTITSIAFMIASIRSRSLRESLEQTIGTKSDRAFCARSLIEMSRGDLAEPTPVLSNGRRIMPRSLKRFMTDAEAAGTLHRATGNAPVTPCQTFNRRSFDESKRSITPSAHSTASVSVQSAWTQCR